MHEASLRGLTLNFVTGKIFIINIFCSWSWPLYTCKCCVKPMLQVQCVYRSLLYYSPPLTSPLVQTADMDNVVRVVTTADRSTMTVAKPIPACPTTQESRKYSITPHMLRRQPNNTPLIQPNLGAFSTLLFLISKGSEPSSMFLSSRGGCSTNSAYRKNKINLAFI